MSGVFIEAVTHSSSTYLDFVNKYFMLRPYEFSGDEIKFQAMEGVG